MVIEVFGFDVQAHRILRGKSNQRPVALIGFGHEILARARLGIGTQDRHVGADTKAGRAITAR